MNAAGREVRRSEDAVEGCIEEVIADEEVTRMTSVSGR